MAYTFDSILDEIKLTGMVPTSQNTFTEARFQTLINREIRTHILPMMLKLRENYFSYDDDRSPSSSGLAISTRAIGGKVQNVALIEGTNRLDLPWISEEDQIDTDESPVSKPGAYIKGNVLYVKPATSHGYSTVRMSIFLRHGKVVPEDEAAQITAIDTGTKTLTFTSGTVPTAWTTSNTFDLIQANPQFDSLAIDQSISSVTTTSMVFSSTLPTRLAVGDWVAKAGETPIIQLPVELHSYLAQLVANQCLKNSPHTKAYEAGVEEIKNMRKDIIALFSPRIEKEGKSIKNRTGMLRRGM